MRILFLSQRFPYPPDRGDRIRSYHTLRHLAASHQVTVGCVSSDPVDPVHRAALGELVDEVLVEPLDSRRWVRAMGSVAVGRSATEAAFFSTRLRRQLDSRIAAGDFDAAYVFCSSMWPYVARHAEKIRTLVDLVDIDSQKWLDLARQTRPPKSLVYSVEGQRTRQLERRIAAQSPVIVVSHREAEILRDFAPDADCHTIANGVDADYFSAAPPSPDQTDAPRCVFVGVQNYEPNVDAIEWFCRQVWPLVVDQIPAAQLDVVGKSPAPRVLALADERVHVTGSVPDVRPFVEEAAVVIAPLRVARGIQNKVLEAMSMGRAVVASPQALDGIDAEDPPARRVESPKDWAEAIVGLMRSPGERHELERRGPEFVAEYFRWDVNVRKIEELLG